MRPFRPPHQRQGALGQAEQGAGVDGHRPIEMPGGDFGGGLQHSGGGVADQDVKRAEGALDFRKEPLLVVVFGDVGFDDEWLGAARGADGHGGVFGGAAIAQIVDGDAGAAAAKLDRNGAANTPRPAGHQ